MSLFENILWISRDVLEVVSLKKVGYLGYGLKCSGPETHVPESDPSTSSGQAMGHPALWCFGLIPPSTACPDREMLFVATR